MAPTFTVIRRSMPGGLADLAVSIGVFAPVHSVQRRHQAHDG